MYYTSYHAFENKRVRKDIEMDARSRREPVEHTNVFVS